MTRATITYLLYTIGVTFLCFNYSLWYLFGYVPTLIFFIVDCMMYSEDEAIIGILYIGNVKRVKTKYGTYYLLIRKKAARMVLVRDRLLFLKWISYNKYTTVSTLKEWVKKLVDEIHQEKMDSDKVGNEIKGWNGYLDKQSERDSKINEIV